ncbi:hypothetical protein C2G38_2210303 [Gigaspora rosea]|uniref:Uncharacterized protein n=1 Tax=Gigaspora rosea TaxID=44941 RepID=A0A397UNI1_9GLOM|nr:hypothetical protein C2G38_2210303 [Gigaspora rosea]
MAQPGPEPGWPKLTAFREHIGEFDRDVKSDRPWRNQLENAFTIFGIKDIMVFGRFSENPKVGYAQVDETAATTGLAAAPHTRWSTEFIMQVLAIIRTKLKGTALEIFDAEIGNINCYWRSDINNTQALVATLKDIRNYPIDSEHPYSGAFHQTATDAAARCTPAILTGTEQKGFREVFDNAFLVDSIQQTSKRTYRISTLAKILIITMIME